MITVLTLCFTHYLRIPFEQFTEKYNSAQGLFMLMADYDKEDYKKILDISERISEKVPIPLDKLDRHVNPTNTDFKVTNNRIIFKVKTEDSFREMELTEDDMQHLLCVAMYEVHRIVLKNIKKYQLETPVNMESSPEQEEILKMLDV